MSNDLIVMDNSIVTSAYNLTLNEQRLIYCALKQMPKYDKDNPPDKPLDPNTPFYITRDDFLEFGVSPNIVAREIRHATRELMKKTIVLATNTGIIEFQWLRQVLRYDKDAEKKLKEKYPNPQDHDKYMKALKLYNFFDAMPTNKDNDNIVARVVFSPEIIPLLSDLRANFTQFLLSDVAEFGSIYTFRIYQLIMQYQSTGYVKISIDKLRFMLMLVDKYPLVADLKRWVIDVAIKEINEKSPYSVQYELIKKGRKFTYLELRFEPKNKEKIEKTKENDKRSPNTIDMFDNLTDKEREIIAQKNAYADQQGITDPLHRQNLINKAVKQYRQAEQDELERKAKEQAELLAKQAEAEAKKQAQAEIEQQEQQQAEQRKQQLIDLFESLDEQSQNDVLDEVAKSFSASIFSKWFKEARANGTAHTDVRFLGKFYEVLGV